MSPAGFVLAVDGGNSKTDVALVSPSARLLALVHGPTISHQQVSPEEGVERLANLVAEARRRAGHAAELASVGVFCLAGADFPSDVRGLERRIGELGLAERVVVLNDGFAALRAGAPRGWGIAVICGAGVNAVGVGPDGRRARLAGIGDLSGDWGGGHGLGMEALGAAVRARDGRGAPTSLERLVPQHLGKARPIDVARAIYEEQIPSRRLEELAPVVFAAAAEGDRVARSVVDRLADELVAMAAAIGRQLRMATREVDVVLAGGVFRTREAGFYARLEEGLRARIPRARVVRLEARPVLGAAFIGLDELGSPANRGARARLQQRLAAN